MLEFLNSFFDNDLDNFNKQFNRFQYLQIKNYFKVHSIGDSFPMLVDRTHNNSIISLIDLEDGTTVVVEILFNDDNYSYSIEQIYKFIQVTTEFGPVTDVEPVTDQDTMMDIAKLIINKARGL